MTVPAYALIGLTAVVAVLAGGLAFAVLRMFAAARQLSRGRDERGAETAFMAAAMEDAMARQKLREQALAARAEASERLSDEIIASLTSGLLVVGADRVVQTLNPFGRKLLGLPVTDSKGAMGDVLRTALPLASLVEECLVNGQPMRRRTVSIDTNPERTLHLGVTVSPITDAHGDQRGAICLFAD